MGCPVGCLDQDAIAFHHVQDMEPAGSTVVGDRAGLHHDTSDLEEHLGQAAEDFFTPAIALANAPWRLDQVPFDGATPALDVEVAERMLDVDRPQATIDGLPEPIIETQRVKVRGGADLEYDIALPAGVGRTAGDQEELVRGSRQGRHILGNFEWRTVIVSVLGLFIERLYVRVLSKAQEYPLVLPPIMT